jgi:ribosomal protein S18 acetylase RimI-like enzyme
MEVQLRDHPPCEDLPSRIVGETDREDLAILLYAAYRGAIDDEGETFADALAEIDKVFRGEYGAFLPDCSFVVEGGEFLASACLIAWWEPHNAPLVVFTMTRPEAQGRGLARHLLQRSMNALSDAGYDRLTLIVTDGNEPAQHLYSSLGFRPIQDSSIG